MKQAFDFNPVKIILKLDGKEHILRRFSLEMQLSIAMRFSQDKGVEHGIERISEILANPENIAVYNLVVTEIVYGLLYPESKVIFPSVCSFRESVHADAEDLEGSDRVSKMHSLTLCLNAAIQNSQPVMDEARIKLENENLKKKLNTLESKLEYQKKILGLRRSSSLLDQAWWARFMNFIS